MRDEYQTSIITHEKIIISFSYLSDMNEENFFKLIYLNEKRRERQKKVDGL